MDLGALKGMKVMHVVSSALVRPWGLEAQLYSTREWCGRKPTARRLDPSLLLSCVDVLVPVTSDPSLSHRSSSTMLVSGHALYQEEEEVIDFSVS